MSLILLNASKGEPITLENPINETKIGLKRVSVWVGWYNINEEQTLYWNDGGNNQEVNIEPGLYSFSDLVEVLTGQIEGFTIEIDKKTGKIEMTIPENHKLRLTDRIYNLLGLDIPEKFPEQISWMDSGDYEGDRPVEFYPKRILIYLKQLSTTKNLTNHRNNSKIVFSQLLDIVPIKNESFGQSYTLIYEKPIFKKLNQGVNELDFDFKIDWENGDRKKLDNHGLPIDLVLEIK